MAEHRDAGAFVAQPLPGFGDHFGDYGSGIGERRLPPSGLLFGGMAGACECEGLRSALRTP
jgi:hypothetical protein